jgi:hypothetical protein
MLRRLAALGLVLGLALGGIGLAAWGWTWAGRSGDPLDWLPRAEAAPRLVAHQWFLDRGRIMQAVTLEDPKLGRFRLLVSLPNPLPDQRLPLVFVLGGLGTAEDNLRPVSEAGANALIGYDWPIPTFLPEPPAMLAEAGHWRGLIEQVPGQLAAAIAWTSAQPWADAERLTLLGVSLGSLAVPATARLSAALGLPPGWNVLAYGGAPLSALVGNHPALAEHPAAMLLGRAAGLVLRGIEPGAHLPHLPGRTLIIGSREDRLIPAAAAERMGALAPEPKAIVWLPGDHIGIGPAQQETLAAVIRRAREWLVREGAINP